ncbi:MarR family winged helix-turn-helix transcriptional regulator [Cellulomonas soli]|uniref:HTH marR-type domain-containing protein n=1 Tax=Cellulomonas soli TaxID=931535 RepID=A0A512PA35_9CELL|nr:MarR family transcriptional regulator [Cellulomonas soli]NYI60548.1 DNA-binding MarR family transcriptional regulator [Cellulomonas soli]GEP68063.1 hypothetical protein CSO01_07780 [Cellulomonas soli]
MSVETTAFGTRLIGQAERTLSAILERLLEGTGVNQSQWVVLAALLTGPPVTGAEVVPVLASTVKVRPAEAQAVLDHLLLNGLVADVRPDRPVVVTERGSELFASVGRRTAEITGRLWSDLAPEDRSAAARVLDLTVRRGAAELAALG